MRIQIPTFWRKKQPKDPMDVLDEIVRNSYIERVRQVPLLSNGTIIMNIAIAFIISVGYVVLELISDRSEEASVAGSVTRIVFLGVFWIFCEFRVRRVNRRVRELGDLLEHLHRTDSVQELVARHNEAVVRLHRNDGPESSGDWQAVLWFTTGNENTKRP